MPPPEPSTAAAVLGELQRRYAKWRQRNYNYSRLLAFLSFIALLLGVLFLQRGSHTSFEVHSTLAAGLLPSGDVSSVDDVYAWLRGLLETVWRDPVCGDGVCESPFEYAQYGRFGCRADCGRLQDIQNLTAIRIDLVYDFSHPSGSIPATELMQQASWNLCPAGDSSGCYWSSDQTFEQLSGSTSVVVPDVPDGRWAVVIKRDIFSKVAGGVRVMPLMERQAQAAKVAAAQQAAAAARATEAAALGAVVQLGRQDVQQLVNATLLEQHEAALAAAAQLLQAGALDEAGYEEEAEALAQQLEDNSAELVATAASCPDLPFYAPDADAAPLGPDTCDKWANLTALAEQEQLTGMVALVLGRLVPAAAASDAALAAGLAQMQLDAPGLYAIVAASRGLNASLPASASAATLAQFYEDPLPAAPAKVALSGRSITAAGMTPPALLARAEARLAEMAAAQAAVAARPEVQEAAALMQPGRQLAWNYTSWEGGSGAYASCRLPSRTPQYLGTCTPRVACINSTTTDIEGRLQVSYSCSAADLPFPSTACGNLCDTQNICAALCECDQACAATQVCQCEACLKVGAADSDPDFVAMQTAAGLAGFATNGAGPTDTLVPLKQEWPGSGGSGMVEAVTGWAGSDGTTLAPDGPATIAAQGRRRRLLQSDDAMLQAVLVAVDSLQQSQAALEQQVQALQAAVADAAAAAADTSTQALIAAGQQQIVAGQAAIKALLSDILGKQTAAAATAAAQMQVLSNLQNLQQQQLAAQAQLEQSAKDQADAIAIALQQDVITLSQALELYRRVRLQTLVASKAAVLASLPCTSATLVEHEFEVEQYLEVAVDTARVRMLGTSNRVIGGLLLFNQRGLPAACANSRFSSIAGTCKNGLDTAPYGVDPVFKSGTTLYNPDLDSAEAVEVYYNCSALPTPTYSVTQEGSTGLAAPHVSNAPPYCAELFSPRSLPYGFHAATLRQFGDGFPVLFDINLDAAAALNWLAFIQEGLYLDSHTQRLLAQVVAYNPELRLFSSAIVAFEFGKGGSVQVRHKIQTLRVELYATRLDAFRLFLEAALTLYIAALAAAELRSLYRVARLTGSLLAYFTSGWHAMVFASTCLLVACCTMWWVLVWRDAIPFAIDLRFDVYRDLGADAAYLALAGGGTGLQAMHAAFSRLQALSDKLAWYAALTGINLLMLIARLLQLMDFQPRLGVVTRSLAHAGPDLLHFGLVFGLVFVGYAFLAHLIFGNAIAGFSTFGGSVNTCFALLLGDTEVNSDLQALRGLQGVAGAAFFWTFEVLVFLVLLNFLLAIIVDAFSQVKERTTDTTGLHTEVAQMMRHAWESGKLRATSRFSRDHLSDAELARLLRGWQSSERSAADINGDGMVDASEAALQEKVKAKALRVQGRVVAEEELRQILQAYVVMEGPQVGDIEASPPKLPPAARLLGSLGLKRAPQLPGHRALNMQAPGDLDKVAHYVMQRFGDEADGAAEVEERTTGDGSRSDSRSPAAPTGAQQGKRSPSVSAPAPARHSGDFSIAAIRAGGLAEVAAAAPREGGTAERSPTRLQGSPGELSNGRRLLHAMQTELEQRGAADAGATLLQLQGSLAATQQRLLEASNHLIAQQASVLQAVGSPAAGSGCLQQSGGSSSIADTGWGLLALPSFRQRSMLRSDSGRAAALLPPGRPPISSTRGGGLEPVSSDDGR